MHDPMTKSEWRKDYYQKNKEKIRATQAIYREKNRENLRVIRKERYSKDGQGERASTAKYRKNNLERVKDSKLKSSYGLTIGEYNKMLIDQNSVCAICGLPPKYGHRLHLDHCHSTNNIRGLLCDSCNNGLGRFADNIKFLENAIKYLKRYNK